MRLKVESDIDRHIGRHLGKYSTDDIIGIYSNRLADRKTLETIIKNQICHHFVPEPYLGNVTRGISCIINTYRMASKIPRWG